MSTRIQATCPTCKTAVLTPSGQIELLLCTDDRSLTTFQFTCPACGPQSKLAHPDVIDELISEGVFVRPWAKLLPLPRLSLDDCIDFHASIDSELDRLLGRVAS